MRRLECPFILKLHATFQTEHKLFFVMDYMGGGDFDKYLNAIPNKALDYETARLYAAEVFIALKMLHDNGVIYRDLKPENILMSTDGHLVLADFGLSKDFGDATSGDMVTKSFVGSPFYVSPDVLRQQPYDKSVDFWSFGILLFRMLYGRTPFSGGNMKEVFDAILRQNVRFRTSYIVEHDALARDLIVRLLERDPARRLRAEEIEQHPYWQASAAWPALSFADVSAGRVQPKSWVPPPPHHTPAPVQEKPGASATHEVTHTPANAAPISSQQQRHFIHFSTANQ
jgi:serine/threonine protein kinase